MNVTRKLFTTAQIAAVACTTLAAAGSAPAMADAQLPDVTTNVNTAPPPPAPPPPPYSLPWQLRPVTAATVLRSDTTVALYENPKNEEESGETIASMFLASYKLTPEIAPLVRLGIVQNSEPGDVRGRATAFVNPIVGVTYARKIAGPFKGAAFLGVALPLGMGGSKKAALSDTASAVSRGVQARSAMDNAMFAVNYTTGIFGLGGAYVANKLTVQLEATLLQLFRTRNEDINKDEKRTNFTTGLHVGYFLAPFVSVGAEYRYQRWLSDAEPVVANADARENQTIAFGPRFHFKVGTTWLRPGISYATAIDKPFKDSHYHMLQVDVPAVF
jgi:opacity protein-like surface antigen